MGVCAFERWRGFAPFQLLKHLTDYLETCYEYYASERHDNAVAVISYNRL